MACALLDLYCFTRSSGGLQKYEKKVKSDG